MTDETYNGWKNHATWCVNLHLSNDEPLYREALERTKDAIRHSDNRQHDYWTREEGRRFTVADDLKDWCEEMFETYFDRALRGGWKTLVDDEPRLLIQDLVTGYLGDVDWNEIADSWIEQVSEQTANA